MKAYFNIYGLPLEVVADHPLLFENFLEDLRHFYTKKHSPAQKVVRLHLTAASSASNGDSYPTPFVPYREFSSQRTLSRDVTVTQYGLTGITVIHNIKKRHIQAALAIDPSVLPDPAYHLCFSRPVSIWLKQKNLFPFHAGCIAEKGRGILLSGVKQAGKSTLSLSAVCSGFGFLSDETPILTIKNGQLEALAFPRRIRLNRSVAVIFPELQELLRTSYERRLAFPITRFWPKCLVASCVPRVLLFPQFRTSGRLKLTPLHSTATLKRLLQDDHFVWYRNKPWDRLSRRHLDLFEQLLGQTKAYTLEYGYSDILRIPAIFRKLLRD